MTRNNKPEPTWSHESRDWLITTQREYDPTQNAFPKRTYIVDVVIELYEHELASLVQRAVDNKPGVAVTAGKGLAVRVIRKELAGD